MEGNARMIAEDQVIGEGEVGAASLWCYLVLLGGQLFALPDDDRTVLLPFIGPLPQVTPLPLGLVPPYVIGLVNVAQRAELLIDLARLLGLRDAPLAATAAEGRRVVVVGETTPPENEEYRLAFAVDQGFELVEITHGMPVDDHALGEFVREMVSTPRGEAALLNMEAVCNQGLRDFGAERTWNEVGDMLELEEP
jgi:chemotaxis signal transduction protein